MSFRYVCRYCKHHIGEIPDKNLDEQQLGFHTLTPEEREIILQEQENGDTHVHVVCEHCQETIQRNPELLLHSSILQ